MTLVGALSVPAYAQTVIEIQVTDDPAHQFDPAVSQGKVAYTDFRNGDADIYVYDIDTTQEVQIGTTGDHQVLEDIDGNVVVFTDYRNGTADIYAYDLSTGVESRLTDDPSDQQNPAVSGTRVVWEDFSTGSSTPNVFLGSLDGSAAGPVSAFAAPQLSPVVSGDLVAWEDLRNAANGGSYDVFAYDLANGVEIGVATGSSTARRPDVDGRRIVYQDDAAGNLDIYLYDVDSGTTQQLTTLASIQQNAHISGDWVVWEDDRNGSCSPASNPDCNWDLYGLDLTTLTEYEVATGPQKQFLHDVDGFDVAFTDDRNGNQDIFVKRVILDPTGDGEPCNPESGAPLYFDETFTRQAGQPVVELRGFDVPQATGGTICLTIDRVAAAVIGLNDTVVFDPSPFNDEVTALSADVSLETSNDLSVELRGKPHAPADPSGPDGNGPPEGTPGGGPPDDGNGAEGPGDSASGGILRVRVVGPVPAPSCSVTSVAGNHGRSALIWLLGAALAATFVRRGVRRPYGR